MFGKIIADAKKYNPANNMKLPSNTGYGLSTNLTIKPEVKQKIAIIIINAIPDQQPIVDADNPIIGETVTITANTAPKQHGHGAIIAIQVALA